MSERILPQAADAERGVISSLLIAGHDLIEQAASELTPDHFAALPGLGIVFAALVQRHREQKEVDFITLTQHLRDKGQLDAAGGAAEVTELFTLLPTAANYAYYATILREKFTLRRIISHATDFAGRAYSQQDEVGTLLEQFQSEAIAIGSLATDAEALRSVSKEEVIERINMLEQRYKNRGRIGGLSTGFTDIDRTLDGLKGKGVYVFAGRPAMGKSALGTNIAEHIAIELGLPVAFFTLEMPREQVIERILFARAEINLGRIRDGFMSEADFPRIMAAAEEIIRGRLILDDTPGLTIAQFRARARKAVLKMGARMIVIDYVQIMRGSTRRAGDNRALEIAEIMQGIRETAKQLNIPIIVLAQIGRGAEERSQSRPALADLKESGAIEEEATVVGLLYRPAYYAKTDAKKEEIAERYGVDLEDIDTVAELEIAKHRNGGVGTIRLEFRGELTRFRSLTERLYSNNEAHRQKVTE